MVNKIASVSHRGLRDWLWQRLTAVLMLAYALTLVIFFVKHPEFNYATWHSFFSEVWVRTLSLITLLAILIHAWIGIWTVGTDYIKCAYARFTWHLVFGLAFMVYLLWGLQILWGM